MEGFDEVEGAGDIEALVEHQQYVLLSVSSAGLGPVARDPHNPAIRLYGAFGTYEDADEQGRAIREKLPHASMLICKINAWILAASSVDSLQAYDARVKLRLEAHASAEEHDRANVIARKASEADEAVDHSAARLLGDTVQHDEPVTPTLRKFKQWTPAAPHSNKLPTDKSFVPNQFRNPRQTVAVVSCIRDETGGEDGEFPEFLIRVHGCLRDAETAHTFVKNHVSKDIRDVDLHIVYLHEWLHCQSPMTTATPVCYRSKELNSIMANARSSERRVKDLERIFMK